MKRAVLRHVSIGLSTLAGAAIVLALVWLTYPSRQEQPEDLLPAEHTLLYARIAAQDDLAQLATWFPALDGVPKNPLPQAAALVRVSPQETAWITFDAPTGLHRAPSAHATNTHALALLRTGPSLGNALTYRILRGSPQEGSLLYLADARAAHTAHPFTNWLQIGGPMIVERTASGVTIALQTAQYPSDRIEPRVPLAFARPVLIFSVAEPRTLLAALLAAVDGSITAPAEGWLREALKSILGEDVSMPFDLAPLLAGPTTLQVGPALPGQDRPALLQGIGADDEDVSARIALLHDRFRAASPAIEERHRLLDTGRTFDDLRLDPTAIEDRRETVSGWEMRVTEHRGGRMLATALLGEQFIISTNADALLAVLHGTNGQFALPIPGESTPVAGGFVDAAALSPLLRELLPAGTRIPPAHLYRWSAAQNGGRILLTVTR